MNVLADGDCNATTEIETAPELKAARHLQREYSMGAVAR